MRTARETSKRIAAAISHVDHQINELRSLGAGKIEESVKLELLREAEDFFDIKKGVLAKIYFA